MPPTRTLPGAGNMQVSGQRAERRRMRNSGGVDDAPEVMERPVADYARSLADARGGRLQEWVELAEQVGHDGEITATTFDVWL